MVVDKDELKQNRCKVKNVHFEGVHRTDGKLLAKIIRPIFDAHTIKELESKLKLVLNRLNSLDAFKNIDFRTSTKFADDDDLDEFDITIEVNEHRRVTGGVKTTTNGQTASLSVSGRLPNFTGHGDTLSAELFQQRHARGGELRYWRPLAPWLDSWLPRYSATLFQSNNESPPSAYQQCDRGLSNLLEFTSNKFLNLRHSISFENVCRHIYTMPEAPIKTLSQSGPSFKSALKYQLEYDNRDSVTFPSSGMLIKLTHENAGLVRLGNVNFKKNEIYVQVNRSIVPKLSITCQGCLNAGILTPSIRSNTLICDKFFAGGPLSLRGFAWNGVGPNEHGYALGARAFWLGGAHIYTPLPFVSSKSIINNHVKFHVFANGGNINDFVFTDNLHKNIEMLKTNMRYSYGIGLVFYFNQIRLELNYCLPHGQKEGDRVHEGPQCGFGLTFV